MSLLRLFLSKAADTELVSALNHFTHELIQPHGQVPQDALVLLDLAGLTPEQTHLQIMDLRRQWPDQPVLLILPQDSSPPDVLPPHTDLIWRPLRPAELHLRLQRLGQQQSEAAGRSAGQGFREAFEKHHAMMLLINPASGRIVDANPAACRFYGYERATLSGMQIQQINLLSEQDVAREIDRANRSVSNYFTFLHRLASGEVRTVEVHSTPVEIEGQALLFSIIHDITQRRKAEEALRQSEEQYRRLFELAPIGIGVSDSQGKLLAFNQAMLTPGAYSREDIEALGHVGALYYNPDDRDAVLKLFLAQGHVNREAVNFRRKDGSPYESLLTLAPIRFEGQPALLAMVEDITERKRAERALQQSETRYRQIVELAEEGIWVIDTQANCSFVNQKMAQMLGFESPKDMYGRSMFEFMDAEGLEISERNLERRRQGIRETHDFKLLTRQGQVLWTSMSTSPIYDEQGAYAGAMAMVTDITARKGSEERIQQALYEREVLLREIHHRVKNNFQVIISLLNMQCRKLSADQSAEPLLEMRHRIRSMALIHERIYQSENLADVDFAEYLQYLTRELCAPASQTGTQVKLHFVLDQVLFDIDQAIPCGLLANELLSNAFKYAFPPGWQGETRIEVQLRQQQGEVILQVADSGIGLPANIDLEQPQSLGLQLVRQLIRQLEGSWMLDPGAGTRWTLRFPLQKRQLGDFRED